MRTEDGSLIYRCLNGEPEAYGLLVDKYKNGIYAYVYAKLGNFHDAQDVTQEVFIKAFRDLHTLKKWDSFVFWLYRIASTQCAKRIQKESKRPDVLFIEDQDPSVLESASINSYREKKINEYLNEAIESLPNDYREVIVLHYLGGMKIMDISRSLGISKRTIIRRLNQARELLREEMLTLMGETYEQQRLPSVFTFQVVEVIKRINPQPISPNSLSLGLSLGLSLMTGLIITVLGIGQHLDLIDKAEILSGLRSAGETKVVETGEYPVDMLDISSMPFLSNANLNGSGLGSEAPSLQNALFMAPQAEGGTWTKRAGMPTGRDYLSSSAVNGKIYAIGGSKGNDLFATVEEYDPLVDKWTKKADMPTARAAFATCEVNGKIYVFGGATHLPPIPTVDEYDPIKDKWTKKAFMLAHRLYLSASAVNGKIYVIGGYEGMLGKVVSTVEEYDPVKDKWTKRTDMPAPRAWLSTSVVNNKIYAIGGSDKQQQASFATVEEYDPAVDKWTKKTDMPTGKNNLSTSVVNGKIYAIGGGLAAPEVYEYDPVADKWTRKTDIPTMRCFLSTSAVNGKIYAIGGSGAAGGWDNPLSTVEEYDPGASESINFKGKLPTTWGETKTALSK